MKELNGTFHRINRVKGGLYVMETITVSKGKATESTLSEATYPPVLLAKFNKTVFGQATAEYDAASQVKE